MMERVGLAVRVHLLLIVSPAMVASLVPKILRNRRRDIKRGLPVYFLALRRRNVLWWRGLRGIGPVLRDGRRALGLRLGRMRFAS